MLRPLRHRDFALVWAGMTISLFGDGLYLVAVPWQTLKVDNRPGALSLVGIAWMLPQVAFLLFGGVVSDRFDRRRVLIAADVLRGAAVAVLGVLAVTGSLVLWELIVLVALLGTGTAMFLPAFTAFVPDIVPADELVAANAIDQFVRPLAFMVVGPLVGGALVATAGAGVAFIVDAATFGCSVIALLLVRARPEPTGSADEGVLRQVRDGLAYVRGRAWLWGLLAATAVSLLCFMGSVNVLLPYMLKNDLGGTSWQLGVIVALAGAGAVVMSIYLGNRGQPRRTVLFIALCWAVAGATPLWIAFSTQVWQLAAARFVGGLGMVGGQICWMTLIQRRVPRELIGRVAALDWLVSASLIPLSYAVIAPLSHAIGVKTTLAAAGIVGGGVYILLLLLVPGVRAVESEPEPAFVER